MASVLCRRRCAEAADRSANGRPRIVCREVIAAADVERGVAHEACHEVWREGSKRDAAQGLYWIN